MKKIIVDAYGSVDVMKEIEVSKPNLKPDQILVKTAAIGVNDPDVVMRKSGPFPTMPKEMRPTLPHMLGQDFSGVVSEVGASVTKFKVGDHVIGFSKNGTYAEFLVLNETDSVAKVPDDLDLVPLGAFELEAATAWSAVVNNGEIKKGQKVLIHGGAGGVGTMAIQIAKDFGAYVITTAKAKHKDYLMSLGAGQVIDYQTQDFSKLVNDLDLVVNLTGPKTLKSSYQIIKKGGRLVSVNGMPSKVKATAYGITATYAFGDLSQDTLEKLIDLYSNDKLKVNISQKYQFNLNDVKQSHLDFEKGSNQGKRVIVF
ncbi:NADP-dependent oxidoreductase [Companilactobacillus halodurans]|uniref:NADP-dependent oxidoreductase n=1 Tax=Companilactobacillus halodurans TaxID=2584183 RepID=A0A5P0ZXG6_9LACO|nr:NADP-dependent oxidoreductase [Companilactobacillus halodurans]MQS75132.1 NADP-dependent oxidoreductase [Companilactobacillus halodurans]MQS97739.1 NADP-dependent oxidoreductase [Companilactobacillus halodurans]